MNPKFARKTEAVTTETAVTEVPTTGTTVEPVAGEISTYRVEPTAARCCSSLLQLVGGVSRACGLPAEPDATGENPGALAGIEVTLIPLDGARSPVLAAPVEVLADDETKSDRSVHADDDSATEAGAQA